MSSSKSFSPVIAASLLILVTGMISAGAAPSAKLPAEDIAKIEAVHRAYSRAWLSNDEAGVLEVFTDDAVLMPHHGGEPRVGKAAMKAFWFPAGGAPTKIIKFDIKTDEIGGSGDIAYARGRFTLAWTSAANGASKTFSNAGTYLDVLRRQPDGSWKITHHMWDDPVPQVQ